MRRYISFGQSQHHFFGHTFYFAAALAPEMQVHVVVVFIGTFAAQGKIGFAIVAHHFVQESVFFKTVQDAVDSHPVHLAFQRNLYLVVA